jgi:hypothetical protein
MAPNEPKGRPKAGRQPEWSDGADDGRDGRARAVTGPLLAWRAPSAECAKRPTESFRGGRRCMGGAESWYGAAPWLPRSPA